MKKIHISFLLFILYSSFSFAQRWDSLRGGINSLSPYVGVSALYVYNGNLYAGGDYAVPGCIASWNGSVWSSLGEGIIYNYYPCAVCCGNTPNVCALIAYNGNLFAGGFFDSIQPGYANAVAQWNGSSWDSAAGGVSGARYAYEGCYDVNAFAIYNGSLYMAGIFQYTGDGIRVNHITQWNGTSWNSVGSGTNGYLNCLAVYNGNLYAGGYFDSAGGVSAKYIAMWNGSQWSSVGTGINNDVSALCVYNGLLYAGGTFDSAGGQKVNHIASWNGSSWTPVGSGILPVNSSYGVFALTLYGPDLCVGGDFDTAGGIPVNNIALWNGSNWSALGTGVNGNINALTTYNGILIAGGAFDSAGGIASNNIAEWISPLGVNDLANKSGGVQVYPNPSNGIFTIQSSVISGQSSVEVYNVLGEKVYTSILPPPSGGGVSFTYQMNLSAESNGIYLYRIISESGRLLGEGKIIVQK